MRKYKSITLFLAVGILTVFVTLVTLKIYLELKPLESRASDLAYLLSPEKTDLKVGEKVYVPLYLKGTDAKKATAYDIKFYYDNSKFKLNNTTPGSFYDNYLTVKWDKDQAWYALALTPSPSGLIVNSDSSMLTLELTAIAKAESTSVSTGASTVYLTKTGGFHPQISTITFNIK